MIALAGVALIGVSIVLMHAVERTPKAREERRVRALRAQPLRPSYRDEDEHWLRFAGLMVACLVGMAVLYRLGADMSEDDAYALLVLGSFAWWIVAGTALAVVCRCVRRRQARRGFAQPPAGDRWPGPIDGPWLGERHVALLAWAIDQTWPRQFFTSPRRWPAVRTEVGAEALARVSTRSTPELDALLNRLERRFPRHPALAGRRRWSHAARQVVR